MAIRSRLRRSGCVTCVANHPGSMSPLQPLKLFLSTSSKITKVWKCMQINTNYANLWTNPLNFVPKWLMNQRKIFVLFF